MLIATGHFGKYSPGDVVAAEDEERAWASQRRNVVRVTDSAKPSAPAAPKKAPQPAPDTVLPTN